MPVHPNYQMRRKDEAKEVSLPLRDERVRIKDVIQWHKEAETDDEGNPNNAMKRLNSLKRSLEVQHSELLESENDRVTLEFRGPLKSVLGYNEDEDFSENQEEEFLEILETLLVQVHEVLFDLCGQRFSRDRSKNIDDDATALEYIYQVEVWPRWEAPSEE